jgi:hypothetical protein
MSRSHVDHCDIAKFAVEKVNLPASKANEYRAQARRLREKLEVYLNDHPDFTLKKMLISGSLAKGTALRSINDIDIACYINAPDAPRDIQDLLAFIAEKLRKAFPNFSPDQVTPQTYSISVNFRGSGLNVDIVPVLYYGDENWYGDLVSQDDGSFLKTSIPRHLEFAKKRKQDNPVHFAQVVRLIKYWARKEKRERDGFRFKSFMIEMVLAKLSDEGEIFSDYPEALQHFFTYIAKTDFNELIAFSDYFPIPNKNTIVTPIKIVDPVNTENIVSQLYTSQQADIIVEAALDAGDAIDAALSATTKQDSVYYWQKIFGPTFQV